MNGAPLPSAPWEFPYEPLAARSFEGGEGGRGDLVVATPAALERAQIDRVSAALGEPVTFAP